MKEKQRQETRAKEIRGERESCGLLFSLEEADHPTLLSEDFPLQFGIVRQTADFYTLSDIRRVSSIQKFRSKTDRKVTRFAFQSHGSALLVHLRSCEEFLKLIIRSFLLTSASFKLIIR